jgi:hypothetical protein
MTSQPLLADSKRPPPLEFARQQIERLVRKQLMGRTIDVVTFVEELLAIATQVVQVSCNPISDRGLRFQLTGCDPLEVDLLRNRSILRMMCARLAVLCQENGYEFMLYGGEGMIRRTAKVDLIQIEDESIRYHLAWMARWTNTPGKHEFTISVMR